MEERKKIPFNFLWSIKLDEPLSDGDCVVYPEGGKPIKLLTPWGTVLYIRDKDRVEAKKEDGTFIPISLTNLPEGFALIEGQIRDRVPPIDSEVKPSQ